MVVAGGLGADGQGTFREANSVERKRCVHCKVKPVNRPRGLCWNCFYDPAIQALYPCLPGGSKGPRSVLPECWGCGVLAPKRSSLGAVGWHVRTTRHGRYLMREVQCPSCHQAHGWPDWSGLPDPSEVWAAFVALG